jgi:hypothetical protein
MKKMFCHKVFGNDVSHTAKITTQNTGSMFDGMKNTVAMPIASPKSES